MAGMPGIVVKITTDTASAVQGLNRVNKALGRTMTSAERTRRAWKFAAAGAAAGATALIGVAAQSVQAFMDEEKSLAQFQTTLDGLKMGDRAGEMNAWIDSLQFSANIADDVLRPAYARLLRSTDDAAVAQEQLQVALDVAAGTGRDVSAVAEALARGWDGNRKSLKKLGAGFDDAYLKSASMAEITQALIDKFGGGAAAQANTLSGSVDGVKIAVDELSEAFGTGLVKGTGDANANLKETEQRLRDLQPVAEQTGGIISGMGLTALESLGRLERAGSDFMSGSFLNAFQSIGEWITMGAIPDNLFGDTRTGLDGVGSSASFAASQMDTYVESLKRAAQWQATVVTSAAAAREAWTGITPTDLYLNPIRGTHFGTGNGFERKRVPKAKDPVAQARLNERTRRKAQARTGTRFGSAPPSGKAFC